MLPLRGLSPEFLRSLLAGKVDEGPLPADDDRCFKRGIPFLVLFAFAAVKSDAARNSRHKSLCFKVLHMTMWASFLGYI